MGILLGVLVLVYVALTLSRDYDQGYLNSILK